MADRANHYDAAFEDFLRHFRAPYVAVDETRRSLFAEGSLKSPDYLVSPPTGESWLVDIKGRKFPSGGNRQSHFWENWATADDITSMRRWQESFGVGVRSALVFAYHLSDTRWQWQFAKNSRWEFRGATYAFYGVRVDDYQARMTRRSRQWDTVCLRKRDYQELRFPFGDLLGSESAGGVDHGLCASGEAAW